MTEAELLRTVKMLCHRHDVICDHRYQPQHDLPGWPDCFLLGTKTAMFRELKSATGALSPAQKRIGQRLQQAGLDWDLWRPLDHASGRIEQEIAALSGKQPWTAA